MKRRVLGLTLFLVLFMTFTVYAHKPLFEDRNATYDNPIIIRDHRISSVVYGNLTNTSDIDFVKFKAKRGDTFYIEMTIPRLKGNEGFRPYIALVGKGIYQRDKVPFEVQEGYGVMEVKPSQPRSFYEKFTQTSYFILQSLRGEIPEDGDYYIAVYSRESGGKYALAVGEKENFTVWDFIKFPYTWLRVKYFFSPLGTILSVGVFGALLYGLYRFIKWKRRG